MRECPNCNSIIDQDSFACPDCQTIDYGWIDHCETSSILSEETKRRFHRKTIYTELLKVHSNSSIEEYKIRLSAFSDSGELGFHLSRIKQLLAIEKHGRVKVILNAASWGYDWDYAYDADPERDIYLPPSLPLPALIEVSRFIQALFSLNNTALEVHAILPPKVHPATSFVNEAGLFSALPDSQIIYADHALEPAFPQGCDDVLVPLTSIGSATQGQLLSSFHTRYNKLAEAGYFTEHRQDIRKVIMEAAENADIWGGGGWVCCFLRQEKRGRGRFGQQQKVFSPARETHLFLHVFSIGSSLATSIGGITEWDAANVVILGGSARSSGGGRGMPTILNTVLESTWGTISISSGNYTRIITPDGLTHEYHSAGTDYLPGVHLCAIIPLAKIADIQSSLALQA